MASVRSASVLRITAALAVGLIVFLVAPALSSQRARVVAQQSGELVRLAPGTTVALATPGFLIPGKRYAFTWAGGGPPQTHTLKRVSANGWVEVEVADENVDPNLLTPGQLPTRWLNAALALSVQEMRPLP